MRSSSQSKRRPLIGGFSVDEAPEDLPLQPLPTKPQGETSFSPGPTAPVVIVPIQPVDLAVIDRVRGPLEEMYQRPTMIASPLPAPKYAFNPTRGQYHSASILKRVQAARIDSWDCAIGIGNMDLFEPETPFIFGEADRSTRSAIISLRRLWPEFSSPEQRRELMQKRLMSEAIHQVGLIRGLAHCPNNRCVMFQSTCVQDTDKKGVSMCANCRKRLVDLT